MTTLNFIVTRKLKRARRIAMKRKDWRRSIRSLQLKGFAIFKRSFLAARREYVEG